MAVRRIGFLLRHAKRALAVAAMIGAASMAHAQRDSARMAEAAQSEPQPTSYQLITRALESGAIDAETAGKYRVFAAFADSRLPAAYRGDDRNMSALPPEVAEVGERLETFSAATRAELEPFFMRPGDAGSWITLSTVPGQDPVDADTRADGFQPDGGAAASAVSAPRADEAAPREAGAPGSSAADPARVTWHTVSAVGGKAKVWWQDRYPGDAAIAQGLANELTSTIWPQLTGLMSQEPFPDNGIVNNGGDAAFDFYLVHGPSRANATWGGPWEGRTWSSVRAAPCHAARYVVVNTRGNALGSASTYGVLQIATHELMHAITFAYRVRGGCPAPWIGEASGDWASNWLYPLTDGEHGHVNSYLASVEYPIDNGASPQGFDRFYGEHFLPLFLQNATGGPGFMPRMWTNFKTLEVLEGVNAVMPGGFAKGWSRFLNQLWNRPPVDAPDGFKQWDRFPVGPMATGGLDLVAVTSQFEARKITFMQADPSRGLAAPGVQPIAGHYRWYKFEPSVRAVTFRNTIREEAITHGTVWAIENIGGTWKQPVDLTEEWQKFWCRDNAQEDLEELVLIFGNIDWKDQQTVNPQDPPAIEAHAIGCAGWTGNTSQTFVLEDPTQSIVVREHVTSTIRFELDSTLITPGLPPEQWKSVGGVLSWNVTVSGRCSGGMSGGTAIVPDSVEHFATMSLLTDADGRRRHSVAGHWPNSDPRYTVVCPEGPVELMASSIGAFFTSDAHADTVATDGKSFTGQYTERLAPGMTKTTRYSFRCQGC